MRKREGVVGGDDVAVVADHISDRPDPGMVLPMDSILQTGSLVLFTKPTATELFGMAARVRDAVGDRAHHGLDLRRQRPWALGRSFSVTTSQSA